MKFLQTPLPDLFVVEIEKRSDERGFFARSFCIDEFADQGLETRIVQSNISFNKEKGTVRGMHYQTAPYEEVRLVRCTKGKIIDMVIDLRKESKTFKKHFSIELSEENRTMVYIPKGFAHGFQTLEDNSEVFYEMSERYHPENAVGVRWNDPAFAITWPLPISVISEKDSAYPDFAEK